MVVDQRKQRKLSSPYLSIHPCTHSSISRGALLFFFFFSILEACYGKVQKLKDACLLPGRKAMTNLNSILKSRDITLPTKADPVKTMVFPVVMYGCES